MRLLLVFAITTLLLARHSRRRNRKNNRRKQHRTKNRQKLELSPEEEAQISEKHRLITDLINSDLNFANDEPFAAQSYFPCKSPFPQCNPNEECRRINKVACKLGQCSTVPTQICETRECAYDCDDHPISLLSDISPDISNSTTQPLISSTVTPAPTQTTTTPKSTLDLSTTTNAISTTTLSSTSTTTLASTHNVNKTKSTYTTSADSKSNCIFMPSRGGFQCDNWESPTISRDLKSARSKIDQNLRSYVKTTLPKFDIPLDHNWVKIYSKRVTILVDEILTTRLFNRCINYHFVLFNNKRPMPPKKLEAESIIQMIRIRRVCGIPLTPLRKQLMLDALWYFTRHCKKLKSIGLAQYILRLTEDEETVDAKTEEAFVSRALTRILQQSSRKWARNSNIFNSLTDSADIPEHKFNAMNDEIAEAIKLALTNQTNDLRQVILQLMRSARDRMKTR